MGRSSQSESDVRRWTHKDLVVDCEELREVRDRGEYRRLRLLGILALLSNSTLLRTWALLCSLGSLRMLVQKLSLMRAPCGQRDAQQTDKAKKPRRWRNHL